MSHKVRYSNNFGKCSFFCEFFLRVRASLISILLTPFIFMKFHSCPFETFCVGEGGGGACVNQDKWERPPPPPHPPWWPNKELIHSLLSAWYFYCIALFCSPYSDQYLKAMKKKTETWEQESEEQIWKGGTGIWTTGVKKGNRNQKNKFKKGEQKSEEIKNKNTVCIYMYSTVVLGTKP